MDGIKMSATTDTGSDTFYTYTAADGTYSFLVSTGYDYYVNCSSGNYSFDPSYHLVSLGGDVPDQDFMAIPFPAQVTPASGAKGSSVPVIITGANFGSDTTVTLTRSGYSDISASGLTVVNYSKITCTLPLSGAATGQWDLAVSAGGQTAASNGAFLVAFSTVSWQWYGAANMSAPVRNGVRLVALNNGKVLAAGGADGSDLPLDTAELYDPAANTWTPTVGIGIAFGHHATAVVSNGKVMLSGGKDAGSISSNVAIYDPAAGSWSISGGLNTARYGHTMTLLRDGIVLVTGGTGDSGTLKSCEIYNAKDSLWIDIGEMPTARTGHRAVLLPSAKVLVMSVDQYDGSTSVYDPDTNAWTAGGAMVLPRSDSLMAVLRDGKVLVAGGLYDNHGSSLYTNRAEIYNPDTNTWSEVAGMHQSRDKVDLVLLPDGRVLAAGGDASSSSNSAEIYDPDSDSWSLTANSTYSSSMFGQSAVLMSNGRVLVAGAEALAEIVAPVAKASGSVTLNSSALAGALISVSGSTTTAVSSASDGTYSVNLPVGGNYTLTPSSNSYTFTPASVSSAAFVADMAQDFASVAATKQVSGTISLGGNPMPGVTVSVSGDASASATTDSSGNYSFTLVSGGSYTLAPAKTNYTFSPVNASTASLAANWTQNFTASTVTYTVHGMISHGADSLAGITIDISGGYIGSIVTDSHGNFSVSLDAGNTYTLAPSDSGYTFTPVSATTATLSGTWTANFNAGSSGYSFSGTIKKSGVGLASVAVSLSGSSAASTNTDSNGAYSFTGLSAGGSYIVTPSSSGYLFTPTKISTTSMSGNMAAQDFTATTAHILSGSIRHNGVVQAGVTVTVTESASSSGGVKRRTADSDSGVVATTVTDVNGYFSASVMPGGSYVITPSKSGVVFWPSYYSIPNVSTDKPNQDFSSNSQNDLDAIVVQGWDNGYVEPKKGPAVFKLNNPQESGHVTVRLYTLRNARLVRTLETDVTSGIPSAISWDGANTDGETVGSGVYLALVNGAGYNNVKIKFGVLK
ncbi:MAG: hypothetical protein GX410_04295 [Elusimicrobia bacterium]|nr:hypothetical protein [Elusimicrobiota bacterium]